MLFIFLNVVDFYKFTHKIQNADRAFKAICINLQIHILYSLTNVYIFRPIRTRRYTYYPFFSFFFLTYSSCSGQLQTGVRFHPEMRNKYGGIKTPWETSCNIYSARCTRSSGAAQRLRACGFTFSSEGGQDGAVKIQ